jgi:hypothetical protein
MLIGLLLVQQMSYGRENHGIFLKHRALLQA